MRYRGSSARFGSSLGAPLEADAIWGDGAIRGDSGIRSPKMESYARYFSCQNASNCILSTFSTKSRGGEFEGRACVVLGLGQRTTSAENCPRSVMLYPFVYRNVHAATGHSTTARAGDRIRSRAPSMVIVCDFTPDWLVTRKKREKMGYPISASNGQLYHRDQRERVPHRRVLLRLAGYPSTT